MAPFLACEWPRPCDALTRRSQEAPFGGVGQPEQGGEGQRNAARSGTGMYRSWRGKEKIRNHIEMKTKKRTRSWPSRGRHIHGRVVMVATAGEWVPVGGRALPWGGGDGGGDGGGRERHRDAVCVVVARPLFASSKTIFFAA
ncbi:hypothetical protein F5148DRAFT_1145877 [Russula earlei]|uniref:Uncharacterized protein n=1 Tax=Russula earlei TaxID=71964 RepID=A0ACC0UM17_9AGAM|nr:hypothetical protein F5148DRAFT_1145877 [Russula earlei]